MTFEDHIAKYGTSVPPAAVTYSTAGIELFNLGIIAGNSFYLSDYKMDSQDFKVLANLWLTYS